MKKFLKNYTILTIALISLVFIFRNNQFLKEHILLGVNLWITKVFPSLFPMFIISDVLIYCHFPELISKLIGKPFKKIFKTSKLSAFVFITALISGTPSNAFLLKELVLKQKLSKEDAEKIVTFSFFNNPLFLYTMLSLIFNDLNIVLKLILIHYSVNILVGLTFRHKITNEINQTEEKKEQIPFTTYLPKSVQKSMNTLIMILGTIVFFLMIKGILVHETMNPITNSLLSGILELTQGLNTLINTNFSTTLKELFALTYMCFGGLSIHMQVKNILSDADISYSPFLKGRILHAIYAIIILLIL